jgi:hypothetical protein
MQTWLKALHLRQMDIKEQRVIGHAISRGFGNYSKPCTCDFLFFYKFSQELRDDASFMLPFVQLDWHILKHCSVRLRSNTEIVQAAVAHNVNAYQYARGASREQYFRQRTIDSVVHELEHGGLYFGNVPKNLRTNKDIIMAAVKAGQHLGGRYFPKKSDNDFIRDVIRATIYLIPFMPA